MAQTKRTGVLNAGTRHCSHCGGNLFIERGYSRLGYHWELNCLACSRGRELIPEELKAYNLPELKRLYKRPLNFRRETHA